MIILKTSKRSKGTNTKEYVILHHTGGGTFKSNCNLLSGNDGEVSVHYILGENGEIAKIGDHKDILWHAGEGIVNEQKSNMNTNCIGIEVVSDGKTFTEAQRKTLPPLVRQIMKEERIKKEKVLRHADIAGYRGKWDLGLSFFGKYSFEEWKDLFLVESITEEQEKALLALSASLSSFWYFFQNSPEIRTEIEKAKKKFSDFLGK
jgi:N-acetylmuramoyl-L-alanine amidase